MQAAGAATTALAFEVVTSTSTCAPAGVCTRYSTQSRLKIGRLLVPRAKIWVRTVSMTNPVLGYCCVDGSGYG